MSKVPQKKVKKKKSKVQEQPEIPAKKELKLTKDAKAELERVEAAADKRYEWAMSVKEIQSEDIEVVLNRMTAVMARMAYPPTFTFNGVNYSEVVGEKRLRAVQYKNQLYAAVKMLIACAEWGIRIGDFKAPKSVCLRCGVKVSVKKKAKAKAKKKVKK